MPDQVTISTMFAWTLVVTVANLFLQVGIAWAAKKEILRRLDWLEANVVTKERYDDDRRRIGRDVERIDRTFGEVREELREVRRAGHV